MARLVASWSKDPNAKVGAVIVRRNRVVATGFNGLPSEVLDQKQRLADKEIKNAMTVHAEENALLVARRSAEGAEIFVHGKPVCPRCAGSIIQAGIIRVVAAAPAEGTDSHWDKVGQLATSMFAEARVQFHAKAAVKPKPDKSIVVEAAEKFKNMAGPEAQVSEAPKARSKRG